MTPLRLAPLLGAALATLLIVVASQAYPGGYDWLNQSISSLFQPTAENGEVNSARWLASAGVILFCASMAVIFALVAQRAPSRAHFKATQIAGIGAMVYAALVTTPMHDALVLVALAFFLVAMLAILHGLFLERRLRSLAFGALTLALVLANASMYYGELSGGFLPVVQKVSVCMWVPWLFVLAYSEKATSA